MIYYMTYTHTHRKVFIYLTLIGINMNAHAQNRIITKWFSKTRMNKEFQEQAVARAARAKEVRVCWTWRVKWTDAKSTRDLIIAIVENGKRFFVALTPNFRRMYCSCPDFQHNCSDGNHVYFPCKHIFAVIAALNRQN